MTYLDHYKPNGAHELIHSWADHTRLNLAQHYDADRVAAIMSGRDPKTQMDRQRWSSLGQRDAA